MADLEVFFDPVCPFCGVDVAVGTHPFSVKEGTDVRWRFISLRILNEGHSDEKPEGYPEAHQRGLEMLRGRRGPRRARGTRHR